MLITLIPFFLYTSNTNAEVTILKSLEQSDPNWKEKSYVCSPTEKVT